MNPTRALALTVVDLLSNGAAHARMVLDQFKPRFSKDGYLQFVRGLDQQVVDDYLDQ